MARGLTASLRSILSSLVCIVCLLYNLLQFSISKCIVENLQGDNNKGYDNAHPLYAHLFTQSFPTNQQVNSNNLPSLYDLVNTNPELFCSHPLVRVNDTIHHSNRSNASARRDNRTIPRIIHVTAKSRCVLPVFAETLQKWKTALPEYDFFFHNDAAVDRLLQAVSNTERVGVHAAGIRPLLYQSLPDTLHCLDSGAAKADLWRAVVLHEYGGLYTDFDNAPGPLFQPPNDTMHAMFVVEQGGYLSQYYMASAAGHTLLQLYILAIQERILTSANNVNQLYVPVVTGPGALKVAFQQFMKNSTNPNEYDPKQYNHVRAGLYVQPHNHGRDPKHDDDDLEAYNDNNIDVSTWPPRWTVTVVGQRSRPDAIVARNVIYQKRNLYPAMNMTHFSRRQHDHHRSSSNETCLQRIFRIKHDHIFATTTTRH